MPLKLKLIILIMGGVVMYVLFMSKSSDIIFHEYSTTTTTTPTPPGKFLKRQTMKNITIERYDPLKLHAANIKQKLSKKMKLITVKKNFSKGFNVSNTRAHMFYEHNAKKISPLSKKIIFNATDVLEKNFAYANLLGFGVVVMDHQTEVRTLKTAFDLARKHRIKLTIVINNYYQRTILTIRKNIYKFLKNYLHNASLFRHKGKPLIYVAESHAIPSAKWKDLLSPNGIVTIRDSPIDSAILGQLKDEEHVLHAKKSHFDGFYTCCAGNGEQYGSTWKNWRALIEWSHSNGLLSSLGVVPGDNNSLATKEVKAGLNAVLRCRPRPTFVTFDRLNYDVELIGAIQEWNEIWSKGGGGDKFVL